LGSSPRHTPSPPLLLRSVPTPPPLIVETSGQKNANQSPKPKVQMSQLPPLPLAQRCCTAVQYTGFPLAFLPLCLRVATAILLTAMDGLRRVNTSHRRYLHMELVLLGLVQTLHDPQLFRLEQPSHSPHRFRLVRLGFFNASGDWQSPDAGLPPSGGGDEGGGSAFVSSTGRTGLRYLFCCTTDGREALGGQGGLGP
jgi:hypothetical protein